MKQVTIGVNEDGQRVDRIVSKLLSGAGKGLVYKAIRKKIVTLNEKKTEPDVRVKEGDELTKSGDRVPLRTGTEECTCFGTKYHRYTIFLKTSTMARSTPEPERKWLK